MRPLPTLLLLLALSAAALVVGRLAGGAAHAAGRRGPAEAAARADTPPPTVMPPPGEDLRVLLGSPVVGATAAGGATDDGDPGAPSAARTLGRLTDLLVDAASGTTRGCIVAVDGPAGPIARRVDLRAEAWRPASREVHLGLGPRAFASLPEFDPNSLEPGTVLASELLEAELTAARETPPVAELRVDLARQRLARVDRDARTLPWVPVR